MPEQHAFAPTAATLGVTNSEEPGPRLMTITGTPNSPTIPRANAVTSDVNEARSSDRHVVPARDVEGGTPRKPRAEKAVEAPAPTAARFRVQFPVKRQTDDVVIETPLMIRTANRTLSLHHGSPLVVWTGPVTQWEDVDGEVAARQHQQCRRKRPKRLPCRALRVRRRYVTRWT